MTNFLQLSFQTSRLAVRFYQRCRQRILGAFFAPDDELKHWIEPLTFIQRDVDERLRLIDAQHAIGGQQAAVAEQDDAVL